MNRPEEAKSETEEQEPLPDHSFEEDGGEAWRAMMETQKLTSAPSNLKVEEQSSELKWVLEDEVEEEPESNGWAEGGKRPPATGSQNEENVHQPTCCKRSE